MQTSEQCARCGAPLWRHGDESYCLRCALAAASSPAGWSGAADLDGLEKRQEPVTPGGDVLHLRCPHCNELNRLEGKEFSEVTCAHCENQFAVLDHGQVPSHGSSLPVLGRFQLVERLGGGTFGTVWKAWDTDLRRSVALKIPRRLHATDREAQRFLQEARAAARLRHPRIVNHWRNHLAGLAK